MPDKTLGIIGGAGPMAGAYFLKKIIQTCQNAYGCKSDSDFPKIILLSVPFTDMLSSDVSRRQAAMISRQLNESLNFLAGSGADAIAIVCNTLHAFLSEQPPNLISLVEETEKYIAENNLSNVLALCTTTSAQKQLYPNLQNPDIKDQKMIDRIINCILKGSYFKRQSRQLERIILSCMEKDPAIDGVVLGCTELSLLCSSYPIPGIRMIDPLDILSKKLCREVFD